MQAAHRFAAGDRVAVLPDRANLNMRPGVYTITRVLPPTAQGVQYRARNELDAHDRVLDDAMLTPAPKRT
jgi:hypothetical protein